MPVMSERDDEPGEHNNRCSHVLHVGRRSSQREVMHGSAAMPAVKNTIGREQRAALIAAHDGGGSLE